MQSPFTWFTPSSGRSRFSLLPVISPGPQRQSLSWLASCPRPVYVLLLLCLTSLTSLAQTTWTGSTSTDWNTATNWNTGNVPTATDDVIIPDVANDPVIGAGTIALAYSIEVQSSASLAIQNTASLTINGSKLINGLTISLYNKGTVNNSGALVIGNIASLERYGILNDAIFNNTPGGTIQIDRTTDTGLYSRAGSFTNAASIIIGASAPVGSFGLYNNATFINTTGGTLQIDGSAYGGIRNYTAGTFTNAASIIIGANGGVGTYGLENFATFTNSGCATLSVFAPFYNNSSFSNQGLLTVSTAGAHSNTGFSNNGILAYPQGNPIPNVTNNALISLPITTCGPTATSALQIGEANSFTVGTTWYKDAALTTVAGTYSPNTFTASNSATGTYPVYFSVTNGLACSYVASVAVNSQSNVAPSITTLTVGTNLLPINTAFTVDAVVYDANNNLTTASIAWGDGSSASISTGLGGGTLSASHSYTTAGVHRISLTLSDACGATATQTYEYAVAYDPSAGFVTGGGWIDSPAGAYSVEPTLTGQANFGFVAKYQKGATVPTGNTEFQFHLGNLHFKSTVYEWLTVAGARAQFKGSGTLNGVGEYGFMLTAIDGAVNGGGEADKFRIKIWQKQDGAVVYDNQRHTADDAALSTAIGEGSIVIHTPKGRNARQACSAEQGELTVQVLGNPVSGQQVEALIGGAAGQTLRISLVSLQGHLVEQQQVEQAQPQQRVVLQIGSLPGVYLLHVSTPDQQKTIRVLKGQ
ncbi:T9SS type A sorting domain-containing protein [Nibrella saemangeumensis]